MKRVIKFRAWDGEHQEMWSQEKMLEARFFLHDITKTIAYEIMQFTGFLDKNGKEIYEGDICKVHDFKPEIVEIKWYEADAGFSGYNAEDDKFIGRNPWLGISPNHFEVIGNIYENSDLLV